MKSRWWIDIENQNKRDDGIESKVWMASFVFCVKLKLNFWFGIGNQCWWKSGGG
jgi:hypothetical protein